MITRKNIKNLKKVGISVFSIKDNRFSDGKRTKSIRIYDTTPDEVFKMVEKMLN
ncbi:MAG TPA: hypothetical protein VMZ91_09905 [Candidatus Paceibacterota bacterium]|nr:hypothetical protein [Candidatus Paceibacterota bacterium]